jgi:phosphatidate cytidylyltransferase
MDPLVNDPFEHVTNADRAEWSGLKTRALSSAILAGVVLAALWQGGWLFTLLVMIAAMIMVKEWNALTEHDSPLWRVAGLFYAAIPCASLIWLRELRLESDPQAGIHLVLYLMLAIWATDIGAYFTGKKLGRHKLAPSISPGKTWEGLGGGIIAAGITGGLAHYFSPFPTTLASSIVLAMILAILAQMGDLFESWMKRRVDVKDSGSLIPGHGGLLDRVDGFTLTTPIFAWVVYLAMTII